MAAYRARNSNIGATLKHSIQEILPNKTEDSLERAKFKQSQVNLIIFLAHASLRLHNLTFISRMRAWSRQ
jgi:hypothetical protein